MSSSCTWLSKALSTPKRKHSARKQMPSPNALIKRSIKSFIRSHSIRNCTNLLNNFNRTWTLGWKYTTTKGRIADGAALARRQCELFMTSRRLLSRKCLTASCKPSRNFGSFCQIKYWLLYSYVARSQPTISLRSKCPKILNQFFFLSRLSKNPV